MGGVQYETDRARFLGRGRGIRTALSVIDGRPLSNTAGSVLDPIFSLRVRVRLAPGSTARVTFSTVVARIARGRARSRGQVPRPGHLRPRGDPGAHGSPGRAPTPRRGGRRSASLPAAREPHPLRRPLAAAVVRGAAPRQRRRARLSGRTASPAICRSCWCASTTPSDQEIVRQLLRAHEYWRLKQLAVDLVLVNEQGTSYAGDLQAALEALVRTSQSQLGHDVQPAHGRVFILRGDRLTPGGPARAADGGARGAAQPARNARRAGGARGAQRGAVAARRRRGAAATRPSPRAAAAARPRVLQRPRRLRRGRPGVRHRARRGPVDAGAVDQRGGEPALRLPGVRVRQRLHLVRQQPRESAHALVERSRVAIRRARSSTSATKRAASCGARRPCRSARRPGRYVARHGQGYSRFEHTSHGIAPRAAPVRPGRRSGQDVAARDRESLDAPATPLGDRLRRVGARRLAQRLGVRTWSRSATRRAAPCSRAIPGTPSSPAASRSSISRGRRPPGPATARSSSAGTAALEHPLALERGDELSGRVGAGIDPCGALQTTLELRPGARATRRLSARRGERAPRKRAALVAALPEGRPRGAAAGDHHPLGRRARHASR